MRKLFTAVLLLVAVLMAGQAQADCTMTPGARIASTGKYGSVVTVPLVCACDASGGTISATVIPDTFMGGCQLIEVEVVPGASVAAVSATVINSRDTKIWEIDTIDATTNQIYGGHTEWGIFPVWDTAWTFSSGDLGANGSVTLYLKLSK